MGHDPTYFRYTVCWSTWPVKRSTSRVVKMRQLRFKRLVAKSHRFDKSTTNKARFKRPNNSYTNYKTITYWYVRTVTTSITLFKGRASSNATKWQRVP